MKQKKKLNLKDALKIGGVITLSGLTGCAGTMPNPTYEDAKSVLNTRHTIIDVADGYKTTECIKSGLRVVAGIYAGTINVEFIEYENGYKAVASGSYSESEHPEAMRRACKDADKNGNDRIITDDEVRDLQTKVFKAYGKKDSVDVTEEEIMKEALKIYRESKK